MLISSDVNLHPALVQMRVTLFFDAAIAMLISSEVSFDLQLIFTLPPALRMLIISLVNFINNNFLNSTVVKVVIKNKGRIHFSNNFKIRHFIFIRVCSLTNKCIEMKIRIGKSFDKETNEVFYQLQFKLDGERTYNAYSYDVFKEESDAKEALNKHLNGEREYTYFVSAEKVKRTIKGNRVDVKRVLAFHVMSAKSNLPSSRIWVKIN